MEESLFIAILHHSDFVDGAVQSVSGPAVQSESLRKNKHMWLQVAPNFAPELADLLAAGKNAREFTAKIVHKLGSCRGL